MRRLANSDKRIALVLSAYPTKHARIGNAVGLDTPKSLLRLLGALRAHGYDIAGEGGHTLRRSAARALYDELVEERGYDGALRRVQTMLDHKHSMTTELYLGLDVDKVARNKALRGKPMFTRRQVGTAGNVIPLTRRDGTDG